MNRVEIIRLLNQVLSGSDILTPGNITLRMRSVQVRD